MRKFATFSSLHFESIETSILIMNVGLMIANYQFRQNCCYKICTTSLNHPNPPILLLIT